MAKLRIFLLEDDGTGYFDSGDGSGAVQKEFEKEFEVVRSVAVPDWERAIDEFRPSRANTLCAIIDLNLPLTSSQHIPNPGQGVKGYQCWAKTKLPCIIWTGDTEMSKYYAGQPIPSSVPIVIKPDLQMLRNHVDRLLVDRKKS